MIHYELRKFTDFDGKMRYIVYVAFREYEIMTEGGPKLWLTANPLFDGHMEEVTPLEVLIATGASEEVLIELIESLEFVKECKIRWKLRWGSRTT